ncbi:MAG: hypothetical protein P4L46_11600 [Fimbriimonas sp.]|nr:hypothetical protein [Fimbriimonas sp.]
MFSYFTPSGDLALRLPTDEREPFLEKYESKLVEAYGIVQKEYVTVPQSLPESTADLALYFRKGYEYTANLRPKPSKKKG